MGLQVLIKVAVWFGVGGDKTAVGKEDSEVWGWQLAMGY